MTEKTFLHNLRRGLGSAIIELKENPNRGKYRDIILHCCLRDISYDWQAEGSKGYYLYDAIIALGTPEYFLKAIIDMFLSNCSDGLFRQLAAILSCYADDKNQLAKESFYIKYDYFTKKKGRLIKNSTVDEGRQWDELVFHLLYIDGFTVFKKYAFDTGEIRRKYPNHRKSYNGWYVYRAESKFGKERIDCYLNREYERSAAIKVLVDTVKSDELFYEQERKKQEPLTVNDLVKAATEASTDKKPRYKMYKLLGRRRFAPRASEQEIVDLAHTALDEENITLKALLLNQFLLKPFPLEITPLIEYAQSDNMLLTEVAIDRLKEFKDERLHDLAIQLLKDKGLKSFALGLLKENYRKSDDEIILAAMKKITKVPHHVQQDIRDIYTHHRSASALPILLRSYQKGDCSFCRYGIVEAMHHCGVLLDDIIEECLYDSYDDTRKKAKKLKKTLFQ